VVQGSAGGVELAWSEMSAPPLFENRDHPSRHVQQLSAFGGRENQLCPTVARIRLAFEVATLLEFVDQFRASGQPEVRPISQIGETDAIDTDVSPDLHVGEADVRESTVALAQREQFSPESVKQSDQELSDRQAVGSQAT
jgi:hypothetical protein